MYLYYPFSSITQNQKLYWFNIITNESTWNKPSINDDFPLILPNSWKLKQSSQTGQYYFYNVATKKSQWEYPELSRCSLNGLEWIGNSCYMDSILLCIFGPYLNNSLAKELLFTNLENDTRKNICHLKHTNDIQNQLLNIAFTIHNMFPESKKIKNVQDFRNSLKKCPYKGRGLQEQFYTNEMRDSGEFLMYLLGMFPISEKAVIDIKHYVANTNSKKYIKSDQLKDKKGSIVVNIDFFTLVNLKEEPVSLENFIKMEIRSGILSKDNLYKVTEGPYKDQEFSRHLEIRKIISAPAVIFSINRINILSPDKILLTKFECPDEIVLESKNKLYLSAVTVYVGEHYVCYFKCKNKWYFYDDMNEKNLLREVDISAKNHQKIIMEQGTQYFYYSY